MMFFQQEQIDALDETVLRRIKLQFYMNLGGASNLNPSPISRRLLTEKHFHFFHTLQYIQGFVREK